jgi:hypothetical protein
MTITTDTYPIPALRTERQWELSGPRLIAWAANDTLDLRPTVDEQIDYLYEINVIDSMTARHDRFGSRADEKQYMGALMRHKTARLLTPGSRWAINFAAAREMPGEGTNYPQWTGQPRWGYCTINRLEAGTPDFLRVYVNVEPLYVHTDSTLASSALVGEWFVGPHHLAETIPSAEVIVSPGNTTTPEESTMSETTVLPSDVTSDEVARLRAEVERLRNEKNLILAEAEQVVEAIYDQAQKRGWCSEYETDFAVPFNRQSAYIKFTIRDREYNYEANGYLNIRVPFSYSTTISVEAGEDADDVARERFDEEFNPEDYLRNEGVTWPRYMSFEVEIDEDDINIEVEES